MESLKAVGVWRKYGAQEVLKGLDLSLAAGSFEALMGPSGCGKSTFLHLAAGLLAADGGTIEIGGSDITKMGDTAATKFRRRHVGVVFQAFNLLNEKTAEQNIMLPLALDGADLGDAAVRCRNCRKRLRLLFHIRPECGKRRRGRGQQGHRFCRFHLSYLIITQPCWQARRYGETRVTCSRWRRGRRQCRRRRQL